MAGGPLSGDRLVPTMAGLSETQLAHLKSFPLSETRLEDAPEGQITLRWGAYDPATGTRERNQRDTVPVDDWAWRAIFIGSR